MKQRRLKNYLKLGILIFGTSLLFTNCQKDDTSSGQDENAETLQNNVKSSYVSGDEIPDIINLLGHDSNTTSRTDASKSSTISSPFGSISIENILEVIDTLGNKKYSFKLTPKTPKTNSIFNLVIDASSEPINIAILEYRMSPNFAQDYHDELKTFSEFTGSIIKFPFSPDIASNSFSRTSGDTCIQNIDEVVDCSIINIDGGTAVVGGGGGGSTTLYDTNTYTGANGGSSGASGNGSHVVWVCDAYHVTHSNPSECSVDGGSGTWIIIIYPDLHTNKSSNTNKSSTENCCDETVVVGEIGINFFDLAIEIRTALEIPARSQEGLWLTRFATDTQLAELNNYIENNKDSDGNLNPEDQDFANLAIEALMNDGEVDFDDNIIYDNSLNNLPCQKLVIEEATGTCSPLTQLILDIFEANDGTNLIFKSSSMLSNVNANTSSTSSYNATTHTCDITITFRESYLQTATDLAIARTAIHESLHATLVYMFKENSLQSANGTPMNGFEDFVEAYINHLSGLPVNLNKAHHELMADFMEDIASSLSVYGASNGHSNSFNFYKKLSWSGDILKTPTYQSLYPEYLNPLDATTNPSNVNPAHLDIVNTNAAEENDATYDYAHPNGTTYTHSPKGTAPNATEPCN